MEAVKDTVNTALESLGMNQQPAAKEPSAEDLSQLKSKYEKAGQEQVFVRKTTANSRTLPHAATQLRATGIHASQNVID